MPEYLTPGVYIEEVNSGPRPIEGVGTAMAAFVGFAPSGKANQPVLITNWTQYIEEFGAPIGGGRKNPHMPGAYMSHSVYGYFQNGGGRCYVVRVAPRAGSADGNGSGGAMSEVVIPTFVSNAVPALRLQAKPNVDSDIEVVVEPPRQDASAAPAPGRRAATAKDAPAAGGDSAAPSGDGAAPVAAPLPATSTAGLFTLRIRIGRHEEFYENVAIDKSVSASAKTVAEAVATSKYVTILEMEPPAQSATFEERSPKVGNYVLKAPSGDSSLMPTKASELVGQVDERTGIEGLEISEDVTMVCCPDLMSLYQYGGLAQKDARDAVRIVQSAVVDHCTKMGDRMAILDPLPDLKPQEVLAWRRETNYDSAYAALYYPWIKVAGPDGKPLAVPPCGHIAGIYARNDTERGVHKAPANEVIRAALEGANPITKGEQALLNPEGVNCIRSFPGRGLRVWGARTLSSDPAWRYINVRRLFNYVEKSIEHGTQWTVFEPNDADLWARVRRDVGAFLTLCWRDGMLFGASPAEAFFVKCDAETNPAEVRDVGQLRIEVGMAPVKPAEFVIFRFSQWAGGGQ